MHHRSSPSPLSLALPLPLALSALTVVSSLSACASQSASPAAAPPAATAEAQAADAKVTRGVLMAPGADDDVAQQIAALRAAEAQLETALAMGSREADDERRPIGTADGRANRGPRGVPAATTSPAPKKAPASKTPADQPHTEKADKNEEAEAPRQVDPCGSACAALASMSRATEHLCGLAGNGDARCEDARARVRTADGRVRAACPACAVP